MIESATVLADEFPSSSNAVLESAFAYYNALRDVGMGHTESLEKARSLIREVLAQTDPA